MKDQRKSWRIYLAVFLTLVILVKKIQGANKIKKILN